MSWRARWDALRGRCRGQDLALQALIAVVLTLSLSSPSIGVATTSIDGSYCAALNELHVRGARAGVDWLYTWGPWGWLQAVAFDERLWLARWLVGDLLVKGLCAVLIVRAAWRLPAFERALALAALFVLEIPGDAVLFVAAYAAFDLALDRPERGARVLGAGALLLLLGLVKFTFFLLALPLCAALLFARGRAVSARAAAWSAGGLLLVVFAGWTAAGQSLLDLPAWIAGSFRISAGYDAAMSLPSTPQLLDLALVALACVAGRIGLAVVGRGTAARELARAAAFAAFTFLAFKQGFVRGSDHTPIFFAIAGSTAFLLRRDAERGARAAAAVGLRMTTLVACLLGAFAGHPGPMPFSSYVGSRLQWTEYSIHVLRRPTVVLEGGRREHDAAVQAWSLPALQQRVAGAPIDVFPWQVGILLLPGWNWTPRPVFQSYLTLDRELMERNERFYARPDAPRFALFGLASIDQRLPTLDDALVLRTLARDYVPVDAEQGMLLLERRGEPRARTEPRVVLERRARFGEVIDVTHLGPGLHVLSAELTRTLSGRARGFLLRSPRPWVELHTRDGRIARFSLVPDMLRVGAVVDPVLANTGDWLGLFDPSARRRLERIVFLPPEGDAEHFDPEFDVRIVEEPLPAPLPTGDLATIRKHLTAPGLDIAPFHSQTPLPGGVRRTEAGALLVCHAPARLRLRLPIGAHKLTGVVGVLPRAADGGVSGPVLFRAFLQRTGAGSPETVFTLRLDPQDVEAHRSPQPFEFEYVAPEGAELSLRTLPLAPGGAVLEGAYWGNLRLD